MNDHVDASV